MSQFYTRYVPQSGVRPATSEISQKAEKRKRPIEKENRAKSKKPKITTHEDELPSTNREIQVQRPSAGVVDHKAGVPGDDLLSKYSVSKVASENHAKISIRHGKDEKQGARSANVDEDGEMRKLKKKLKKVDTAEQGEANDAEMGPQTKHSSVLSKFNKAKASKSRESKAPDSLVQPESVGKSHGLEPIPQPAPVASPAAKPTYSTLPTWQSEAVRVVHGSRSEFSDFGLSDLTVRNLKRIGLEESFAIQTTMLPLLLDGSDKHNGDICVSAATGSGKTLAYVVPMVEALSRFSTTKLRGLVVVPTRELVQQVRQLCEAVAASTDLKVVAASGSKSLKEERHLLVSEHEVYDPREYVRRQNAPVDWENFSMEELMRRAQPAEFMDSANVIKVYKSKADILITTPGRLVDHLRSTVGFGLDYVKWLVIDEADRLLNESYQEWIDVVTPALESQAATSKRDGLLRSMRMDVPPREITKVLLSATMTRDISQLNVLGLRNPKLVVLGSHAQAGRDDIGGNAPVEPQADEEGAYHLPPTLIECVVPLKDGYDKPLYLTELLKTRILLPQAEFRATGDLDDASSDSDEDAASSDESSSTTSSDSSSGAPKSGVSSFITKSPRKQDLSPSSLPTRALVFTRSTSAATRLARLLALLSPDLESKISTLTKSTTSSAHSRRAFTSFRRGAISILIATDRASRGLDIHNLNHVVSYDIPASALTYVHRVGRTARAGKAGTAWTLVEHREGRWFWQEIGGKNKDDEVKIRRTQKVKRVQIEVDVEAWKEKYEGALGKLGEEVKGE